VQPQLDIETVAVAQLVARYKKWSHWRERVERFGAHPLAITELQITGGDIVENRVACDVIQSALDRYVPGASSDNNGELGLVLDLAAHLRDHDRFLGADNGAGIHCEQQWQLRRLTFDFLDMILVVQADAEDFLRMCNRGAKHNIRGREQETLNS